MKRFETYGQKKGSKFWEALGITYHHKSAKEAKKAARKAFPKYARFKII